METGGAGLGRSADGVARVGRRQLGGFEGGMGSDGDCASLLAVLYFSMGISAWLGGVGWEGGDGVSASGTDGSRILGLDAD